MQREGSSITPSVTPSEASPDATAAAVAASSLAFGTKFPAATMTTCGQRSAGRNRCQLMAGQAERMPS